MSRTGCYDIYITTPEGRDYHSSELGTYLVRPLRSDLLRKSPHPADPVRLRVFKNRPVDSADIDGTTLDDEIST